MESARIVTWNICSSPDDQEFRLEVAMQRLKCVDADVVCLQEVWEGAAEQVARELGMTVAAHTQVKKPDGQERSDVAILSRWEILTGGAEQLPGSGDRGQHTGYACAHLEDPHGGEWVVHSAHLAWGSRSELTRARQARHICHNADQLHQQHPHAVQVLTGDFNTLPDSLTVRYLTSLEPLEGDTALWVDAWAKVGEGPGWTSDPLLPQSARTARGVGITRPELLPQRRIDYVMVFGFAHGRPGCPLAASLIPGDDASDHHGIRADLWFGTGAGETTQSLAA